MKRCDLTPFRTAFCYRLPIHWFLSVNRVQSDVKYDFVFVDQEGFEKYKPKSFRQRVLQGIQERCVVQSISIALPPIEAPPKRGLSSNTYEPVCLVMNTGRSKPGNLVAKLALPGVPELVEMHPKDSRVAEQQRRKKGNRHPKRQDDLIHRKAPKYQQNQNQWRG